MRYKLAILQVADTGPLESLVVMLQSAGYTCALPNDKLKRQLRDIGCDTVLDIESLVRGMGYEQPFALSEVGPESMNDAALYVDIKAHRNGPKVVSKWPKLEKRILWYRINGGKPEHVIKSDGTDCGDEVNPICPILTPNRWYADKVVETTTEANSEWKTHAPAPWLGKAYSCWPPFYRFSDYFDSHAREYYKAEDPICLIHNLQGWGYGALIDNMRNFGVKCYGAGSPDGLINHAEIPRKLSTALAMVHLKSSDAPGYALYEGLAAACPLVVTRRLVWRNRMEDLFIPNETCLVFDRETHDHLSEEDVASCTLEVHQHLSTLSDTKENRRIGLAGYEKLKQIMWSDKRAEDVESLREFLDRHFGA